MWGLADVARLVRNGKRVQVGGVVGGRHHHHHYGSGALLTEGLLPSILHQRGYRSSGYSKMSQGEKEGSSPASEGASAAENNADTNNGKEKEAEEDGSKDQKDGESDVSGMDLDELREFVEKMRTKEQEYRTQIDDLKDKMVRTLADMENLRDRTSRQLQEARQFATQSLVKSLVEVADNLERAAGSILKDENMDEMDVDRAMTLLHSLRDGVIMTDGILMKILEKEGVKRFDPLGHQFDPNVHNALFEVPDATKEPGTVAVVIKKGYMLHDRAVRAADVGVVKASD
jgi:molecular chaperone GrpE